MFNAIMKAADKVEKSPCEFQFMETGIPDGCGSPGCALGWIGHFLGGAKNFASVPGMLGLGDEFEGQQIFYARMDALSPDSWRWDGYKCARTLRLYAEKYHSPVVELPVREVPHLRLVA